jgi:hypothetical protein
VAGYPGRLAETHAQRIALGKLSESQSLQALFAIRLARRVGDMVQASLRFNARRYLAYEACRRSATGLDKWLGVLIVIFVFTVAQTPTDEMLKAVRRVDRGGYILMMHVQQGHHVCTDSSSLPGIRRTLEQAARRHTCSSCWNRRLALGRGWFTLTG